MFVTAKKSDIRVEWLPTEQAIHFYNHADGVFKFSAVFNSVSEREHIISGLLCDYNLKLEGET